MLTRGRDLVKKKTATKKLALAKETVKALEKQDLAAAQGRCVLSNCHCVPSILKPC